VSSTDIDTDVLSGEPKVALRYRPGNGLYPGEVGDGEVVMSWGRVINSGGSFGEKRGRCGGVCDLLLVMRLGRDARGDFCASFSGDVGREMAAMKVSSSGESAVGWGLMRGCSKGR